MRRSYNVNYKIMDLEWYMLNMRIPIVSNSQFSIYNINSNTFLMNKEKLTKAGFEPATCGLTCRHSTN